MTKRQQKLILDSWIRNTNTNDVRDVLEDLGFKGADHVADIIVKYSPANRDKTVSRMCK